MTIDIPRPVLKGVKALVVGVSNQDSIAYGCAKAFRELGAELAITGLRRGPRGHPRQTASGQSTISACTIFCV